MTSLFVKLFLAAISGRGRSEANPVPVIPGADPGVFLGGVHH